MGSWSEQQEVKKEVKEKEKTSRETVSYTHLTLPTTSRV